MTCQYHWKGPWGVGGRDTGDGLGSPKEAERAHWVATLRPGQGSRGLERRASGPQGLSPELWRDLLALAQRDKLAWTRQTPGPVAFTSARIFSVALSPKGTGEMTCGPHCPAPAPAPSHVPHQVCCRGLEGGLGRSHTQGLYPVPPAFRPRQATPRNGGTGCPVSVGTRYQPFSSHTRRGASGVAPSPDGPGPALHPLPIWGRGVGG